MHKLVHMRQNCACTLVNVNRFAHLVSVQVLHQHVWGGRSEQNADPVDAFEVGGGGLSQKDDMLTL